ncbi:serine/threonine protein phosphatase [Microbispora rosea subsp. aerata]|nr:Stp1/IreP family PP2C-type Ser/Thr phosphatase [Microbispora rosea]GGO13249.1 serine/threonine protein phosphatase [Microbispora rosea subsp. aerata]GIH58477.1 serine/threonine protein phosphatase [Microbispora rosea subsp. aerata]GLJ85205.1 serine/threonine protein phosphatase [Microbispora rosea subsp. aerata]
MTIALRYAARSDVGLLREGNEDSAYASGRLLAVADGMGGHAHGEVASSVAIAALSSLDRDASGGDLISAIEAAVRDANHQLHAMVARDPSLKGMGTTLTAMLWNGSRFALVHVGDSRAYLLRNGELYQITHDHTLVQSLVDDGRITQEEAANHPQRSILLRALDGSGEVDPDLQDREAQVGDRYLLCSDGLSTVVSAETLHHTLTTIDDPEDVVRQLIDLANRGGGPDNITCVVADVIEVDDMQPPQGAAAVVGAAGSGRVHPPMTADAPAGRATTVTAPQPVITDDDLDDEPVRETQSSARRSRRGRTGPKVAVGVLVVAAALGAGGYFGYQWTQSQFYIGVKGDEIVVFQGVDAEVGPVSFKKVAYTEHLRVSSLPAVQQDQVRSGIPVADLQAGITRIKSFGAAAAAPDADATPTPTRSNK